MHRLDPWKVPFLCALAFTGLPLLLIVVAHNEAVGAPQPAGAALAVLPPATPESPANPAAPAEVSLRDALGRHWIQAEYLGNGHSEIKALITSTHNAPIRLQVASGLIFESGDLQHQMVVAAGDSFDLPAGSQRPIWLQCAATRSANSLAAQTYHLGPENLALLDKLFVQVDQNPETSREAVQTAVLLLTENSPLSLFAKFTLLGATEPQKTTAYQVNTGEILAAFELLKAAGYSRMNMTAAHVPQLKVEAMIDPLAHAAAQHYYGIAPSKEWAFWRDQLEKGDPATRHYALYGIGRYYPDVALQMLPAWVRAGQLSPLFRTSAMQAMAETHKPEAISVLQQLVSECGAATALGQSGRKAIAYLENQRATPVVSARLVEFKLSSAELR